MTRKIKGGTIETEVYAADGYVVIRQRSADAAAEQVCALSVDQLPQLIRELQDLYDDRVRWQEAPME